ILETIPFSYNSAAAQVALVQVEYTEGDPETYFLPLAFAADKQASELHALLPQAAIARLRVQDRRTHQPDDGDGPLGENGKVPAFIEGFLYDPLGEQAFSEAILESMVRRRRFKRAGGEILAWPDGDLRQFRRGTDLKSVLPGPALLDGEHGNTDLVYGDRFILK